MRCFPIRVPALFIALPALLTTLLVLGPSSALGADDEEPETENLQPPRPDGPVRHHSGPRGQWTPERWLSEAYYLEGEMDLVGAVDALWTAVRLGGGGQRHAYDLGRLLVELLRGVEAREAFCLARLGPRKDWKELAEERLAELGEKGPHWCDEGEDWDPYDWRRNRPSSTRWRGDLSPCDRAMDRAWALKNAERYVEAIAMFGEAEAVCPDNQLIELEVAYCLLFLKRPDAASVSLFEVTLGPDGRLVDQADRQLTVMPQPSNDERKRRDDEVHRRRDADAKAEKRAEKKTSEGEAGGSR
jgi:tetratricopeptide (TPR) repeat protein